MLEELWHDDCLYNLTGEDVALAEPAQRISREIRDKRILVVDDNEMLLKAWSRILGERHLNVPHYRLSAHPEQALHWLRQEEYDIVIVDIVMPNLDGFDFIREAWKIAPNLKLVFTTAYNCDFGQVTLPLTEMTDRDVHVLLKPYQDIEKVEEFIERLVAEDTTLNDMPPIHNRNELRFHLWHL